MESIKKFLMYFFYKARFQFRSELVYRSSTILKCISQSIMLIAMATLWQAIYTDIGEIGAFNLQNMLAYWVLSISLSQIYPLSVSGNYSSLIKNGKIATLLLKPVKIELQLFAQACGKSFYNFLFATLPLLVIGRLLYDVHFNVHYLNILLALLFVLIIYLFLFFFEITVGCLSYYTQSFWGMQNCKNSIINFLSGKLLPLSLYPQFLKNIFGFLPFMAMYYLPIHLLLYNDSSDLKVYYFIAIISLIAIVLIYSCISRKMYKHIMIQGG